MFGPWPADTPTAARAGVVDGSRRRIDLVTTDRGLGNNLIDPTVVDPATPAAVAAAVVATDARPNRVADEAEAVKKVHYSDPPPGFTLRPVALTTQASCGEMGQMYMKELGLALARRRNDTADPRPRQAAAAVREVRERIGVALMRELADQLAMSIAPGPHAALAIAERYVHTAWRAGAGRGGGEAGADGQPDMGAARAAARARRAAGSSRGAAQALGCARRRCAQAHTHRGANPSFVR